MKRKNIRAVIDYIARNHRCTFPSAWDTGEGIQAPGRFAPPHPADAAKARQCRDELVEEIKAALTPRPRDTDKPDPNRLYVAAILFKDGTKRHIVCKLRPVNDGAAYECVDPVTGDIVGSVGRNNLSKYTEPLDRWTRVVERIP